MSTQATPPNQPTLVSAPGPSGTVVSVLFKHKDHMWDAIADHDGKIVVHNGTSVRLSSRAYWTNELSMAHVGDTRRYVVIFDVLPSTVDDATVVGLTRGAFGHDGTTRWIVSKHTMTGSSKQSVKILDKN